MNSFPNTGRDPRPKGRTSPPLNRESRAREAHCSLRCSSAAAAIGLKRGRLDSSPPASPVAVTFLLRAQCVLRGAAKPGSAGVKIFGSELTPFQLGEPSGAALATSWALSPTGLLFGRDAPRGERAVAHSLPRWRAFFFGAHGAVFLTCRGLT